MGEIISIVSQKGGVGKTTTAVNLCASLAALDCKVLLIDLDPQGHVATSFSYTKYDLKGSIYDVLFNDKKLEEIICSTSMAKFDFISSSFESDDEEKSNFISPLNELTLKKALAGIKSQYDYIFIDCPPTLNNATSHAIIAADSIIVPIQCEYYSLKALGKLLQLTRNIKVLYNHDLKYRGFLLTMVDLRNNLSKRVMNKVRYTLKSYVFDTMIPRNIRLAEVPYYGKPVILIDKTCKGAISYMNLASEILNQNGTLDSDLIKNYQNKL